MDISVFNNVTYVYSLYPNGYISWLVDFVIQPHVLYMVYTGYLTHRYGNMNLEVHMRYCDWNSVSRKACIESIHVDGIIIDNFVADDVYDRIMMFDVNNYNHKVDWNAEIDNRDFNADLLDGKVVMVVFVLVFYINVTKLSMSSMVGRVSCRIVIDFILWPHRSILI